MISDIIIIFVIFLFVIGILCSLEKKREDFNLNVNINNNESVSDYLSTQESKINEKLDEMCPYQDGECKMTKADYNNLEAKWDDRYDDKINKYDPEILKDNYIAGEYAPLLKKTTDNIMDKASYCYDRDDDLAEDSGRLYTDCRYVKNLFSHLGKDKMDELDVGRVADYCPQSMVAPSSSSCLRKVKTATGAVSKMTQSQLRNLADHYGDDLPPISKNVDRLAKDIDSKIDRDYIKTFLNHQQHYLNTVSKMRNSEFNSELLDETLKPPQLNLVTATDNSYRTKQKTLENQLDLSKLYGRYTFNLSHTQEVHRNNPNNIGVSESDMKRLVNSYIDFDRKSILIRYVDGTNTSGLFYDKVEDVGNDTYQLTGNTGVFEVRGEDNNLYVKVVETFAMKPYHFLEKVTYLLEREK